MLLTTGIELELISDAKVLDIIERQKRGGLCFVGSKDMLKQIINTWIIMMIKKIVIILYI